MLYIDTKGGPTDKVERGIYSVKDGFLMLCYNIERGPRPERFGSSAKPRNYLVILRRGILK